MLVIAGTAPLRSPFCWQELVVTTARCFNRYAKLGSRRLFASRSFPVRNCSAKIQQFGWGRVYDVPHSDGRPAMSCIEDRFIASSLPRLVCQNWSCPMAAQQTWHTMSRYPKDPKGLSWSRNIHARFSQKHVETRWWHWWNVTECLLFSLVPLSNNDGLMLLGRFRAFREKSHSQTSQRVMQKITQRSRQLSKL
jgi:hypothetical protein